MISKEQFTSSILYACIGDAFGMPFDSLNPTFIHDKYPEGFYTYQEPFPISRHNRLASGSLSDIGGTMFMIMEMLNESNEINTYQFQKHVNRFMRNSSVKKHDYEKNYDNFQQEAYIGRPGLTNISRALPFTLTNLSEPNLEQKINDLSMYTHTNEDSINYAIFHNMLLKDLAQTMSLPHSIFNCLKYLPNERDKNIMYRLLEEHQKQGVVDVDYFKDIAYTSTLDDIVFSNYPLAIASALNERYSLIERFLCSIYMGGATSFNCFIIGSIHGILNPDIESANEDFLERLHYGHEIRIIDIYDLVEALYEKYYINK